jgi:hypothetical protein
MPKITMPPTGIGPDAVNPVVQVCEKYLNDPLELTIASPGFLAFSPTGAYNPAPPVGFVLPSKKPIGTFYPGVNGASIVMSFFDFGSHKLYVTEFNVTDVCVEVPAKKKVSKKKAKTK